jgi:hypothetical protein
MKIVFSLLVSCVLICSGCINLFHQGGNELHVAVNGSDLLFWLIRAEGSMCRGI